MVTNVLANIRKEKKRKEKVKAVKKVAIGTISGLAAGLTGGILLAPKSGKETRKDISGAALNLSSKAKDNISTAKNTLETKHNELKSNISEAREKIANYISEKKSLKAKNIAVQDPGDVSLSDGIEEEVSSINTEASN